MNYEKIHDDLVNLCKTVDVDDRLKMRNSSDYRIGCAYTEVHHIVPRHDGGTDDETNLVRVLPEEHYMLHLLRYKIKKQRNDFLAIRFMINGYKNNSYRLTNNKSYAMFKHHIQKFRSEMGWHTKEGRKSISESSKGKVVVKDEHGNFYKVDKNDPRYVSGELVHHTKGMLSAYLKSNGKKVRISVDEYQNNKHLYDSITCQKGKNNTRYFECTEEIRRDIMNSVREHAIENNHYIHSRLLKYVKENYNKSHTWVKNHFGNPTKIVEEYNEMFNTNVNYVLHYKTKETRAKLSRYILSNPIKKQKQTHNKKQFNLEKVLEI